nr:hypothetical protein L204_05366 [Cryptococcus depauperatus CBS 7855]
MGDYLPVSPYVYTPTAWICILFTILFAVLLCVHIAEAIKFKYWIVFPTLAVGIVLEIMGWAGRYWSSQKVLSNDAFLMQIICLIIAPVFFSGWCYTLLGIAIHTLGQQYSLLRPKTYIAVFVTCDVISLVLQAIGGGWAASVDPPTPKTPTNIMVVGIIFQLISMVIFSYLAFDFIYRVSKRRPYQGREQEALEMLPSTPELRKEHGMSYDPNLGSLRTSGYGQGVRGVRNQQEVGSWRWVMLGIAICSLMIIIRGFYRSVELVQGWDGYLITHEVYQNTLDGIPMVICLVAIAVFHPGFFLSRRQSWKEA